MGYELRINRTGQKGDAYWERVGLFNSSQEASDYRNSKYPTITKYTILGVKLSAPAKENIKFMFVTQKEAKKGGTHNAPK